MPIEHSNLRSFDLNVMLAFDALMQERNVTKAARRLRIQQPAMSHALANLRLLFSDPLFVRVGQVMEPTPRAHALEGPIRRVLEDAQRVLLSRFSFDAAEERRTFRLGLSDQLEILLAPAIVERLAREAPGIRLVCRPVDRGRVFDMLDEGLVDFAIGSFLSPTPWVRVTPLFEERHVCCFNPALVEVAEPLTLAQLQAHRIGVVSRTGELMGYLGDALRRARVELQPALSSETFSSLLEMASRTPILAILPGRFAHHCTQGRGLAVQPLPFELESFTVDLVQHARNEEDAGAGWMRSLIQESANRLRAPPPQK